MSLAVRRRFPRQRGRIALVGLFLAAIVGWLASGGLAPLPNPAGRAHVIDGDTISIAGTRIRLADVDAPELAQPCLSASGAEVLCGRLARDWLITRLRGHDTSCAGIGRDTYGRLLATCKNDGRDVGRDLVEAGWAMSRLTYLDAQESARSARRGLWQGSAVPPDLWRRSHEDPATPWGWIRNLFG